jgi:hypothetical protein
MKLEELTSHFAPLALSEGAARLLLQLADAAISVERAVFPVFDEPAWCITLPRMEEGEPIGGEVRLFCSDGFTGALAAGVPQSVARLVRLHNRWGVQDGDDLRFHFGGATLDGLIAQIPTVTDASWEAEHLDALRALGATEAADEPVVVDCFPNGWACIDPRRLEAEGEPVLRWVSEELRRPGRVMFPGCSLGEAILQTIWSGALGY